jgi:hypothetical protein
MERLLLLAVGLFIAARMQRPKPVVPNGGDPRKTDIPQQLRPGGAGGSQSQSGGTPSGGAKSDDPTKRGGYVRRGIV